MEQPNGLIEQYLCEQVALEEQLCKLIEQQIDEVDEAAFPEARQLLINAKDVLELHFKPLNQLLDRIDKEEVDAQGSIFPSPKLQLLTGGEKERVSRILLEDHSMLNLIAMGNSMLHTTALALGHEEVAGVALDHLHHLASLVIKIGELLPIIVTRELQEQWGRVNPAIGDMAVKNLRLAWLNNGNGKAK